MRLDIRKGRTARLIVTGRIDMSDVPGLRRVLLALLDGGRAVEVDLADTDPLNSAALSVLIEALAAAKRRGVAFRLIGADRAAGPVAGLCRLDRLLLAA